MKTLQLIGKYEHLLVKLDDSDYDEMSQYRWYYHPKGYAQAYIGGKSVLMHRMLLEFPPKSKDIDHKNGDKLDNQRDNLRVCDRGVNVQNQKHWSKYGFKGVCKNGKYWQAAIYHDKKRKFLGNFKTIEEAAIAYNNAALELYGVDAYLNKI